MGGSRARGIAYLLGVAGLGCVATGGAAQTQPEPPPPSPDTTTVTEAPTTAQPVAAPPVVDPPSDAPPAPPPSAPPPAKEKEHVPPDASEIDLSTLETKNLSLLYFDPVQTYLTPYIGRAFENAMRWHKDKFAWTPWDRTTLLLKDFGDYGNAGARSSPNNAVLLDVAPLSQAMETFTPGERFFTLTNHELAHVATMDVWNAHDAWWRRTFRGKPMPIQEHPETILYSFLTTPRTNVPRWYLEGSAVFFETWMAGGLGRAQGAYDEMVFRAKVRDGTKLYSPLGLESEGTAVDFQVGVNDYLYGTRFFSWLALTHGTDKVLQWLRRDEGSHGYYSKQFKQVYGEDLDTAWAQWIADERVFQRQNLDALGKYPLTPLSYITERGLGSVSRTFYDAKTDSLVGAFRYPGVIGFVGTIDARTGKLRNLADIKGAMLYKVTSLAFDPDARHIYYTEDNYAFRDVIQLNVDTGKKKMLLRDARIGDLVVNPADKAIWGIRHQNGFATLVRIPPPYAGFNQIHTFDYGVTPFDLDISPDGSLISASVGEVNGEQSVRVWRTADFVAGAGGGAIPAEVGRLNMPPSTPEGFVFAPDGKSMYGSAYYTGVSNIYRFDIATGKFAAVSNASTGLFRPVPQADGSLIVYDYAGEGMTPARMQPVEVADLGTIQFYGTKLVEARPELKQWGVGSPARVDLDAMVTERGKYVPTGRIKLAAAYPVIEGYQGGAAFGYHLHFEDPMQFRQLDLTLSASPFGTMSRRERIHADIRYRTPNWDFRYRHNDADFYDLFGPVERSRRGNALSIGYKKTPVYDPPRLLDWFASAAAYWGLKQLPNAQNVLGPSAILSGEAGLRYTNTTKSLGAVDHEKGMRWELIGGIDQAQGQSFPKLHGGFDYGVPLPLKNSSIWLYTHAGVAGGPAASPLASYYFGSFRNNYVDDREVKRYRGLESFPGFDIDEISARKFAKVIGEVNLPPVRFAEVGTPAFYLSSIRPALFAGLLATSQAGGVDRTYKTLGGQLDLNFTVALRLPMTLSVGAAAGFDRTGYRKTELLVSLKIL